MKCLGSSGVCILDIYVHIFTCAGLVSQVETDAEQSPGTGRDAEGEKELREERYHYGGARVRGKFSQISAGCGPS